MAKRKVGKIRLELPSGEEVAVDKINDPKLTKMLSYLMNGYTTYSGLHRGPKLPKGARVQVFGTRIPIFTRTRKGAYNSGVTKPTGGENYTILIDERLKTHEKLAVLAHELGHIVGGYKESDRESQKIAIQNLNNVLVGYEKLSQEPTQKVIKRDLGVDYNPEEVPREEVRDALQYLTQSGEVFDVGPQEWSEAGLPHTSEYKGRRKRKGLEDYTSIILVLIGFFLMFGNDTGITGYSFFESIFSIKNINIFGAIFLILGILILLKKRLK
jgi:hypothetical protein